MKRVRGNQRRQLRHGTAAVEFACIAPLFFLMLMGMLELGRAVNVQQMITDASRDGCRLGTYDNITSADIQTLVVSEAQAFGVTLTTSDVTVTPQDPGLQPTNPPTQVTVTVNVPYSSVALGSWSPWFLSGVTLSATTSMQREQTTPQGSGS